MVPHCCFFFVLPPLISHSIPFLFLPSIVCVYRPNKGHHHQFTIISHTMNIFFTQLWLLVRECVSEVEINSVISSRALNPYRLWGEYNFECVCVCFCLRLSVFIWTLHMCMLLYATLFTDLSNLRICSPQCMDLPLTWTEPYTTTRLVVLAHCRLLLIVSYKALIRVSLCISLFPSLSLQVLICMSLSFVSVETPIASNLYRPPRATRID